MQESLEKDILRSLFRHRIIGEKHTAIENLTRGMARHRAGEAKKAVSALIRKGYITIKQTSYGTQVSINTDMLEEIRDALTSD